MAPGSRRHSPSREKIAKPEGVSNNTRTTPMMAQTSNCDYREKKVSKTVTYSDVKGLRLNTLASAAD